MTEQITTLTKITNDPSTGLGSSSATTIKVHCFLRDYDPLDQVLSDERRNRQNNEHGQATLSPKRPDLAQDGSITLAMKMLKSQISQGRQIEGKVAFDSFLRAVE